MLGHIDTLNRSLVEGWAANPARPGDEVAVRVTVGSVRARAIANLQRDDLTGIFDNATGRYGFRLDTGPFPLSPFMGHTVEIVFASSGTLIPGGIRHVPPIGGAATLAKRPGPKPLVITTTGRSGSSLLMAKLNLHPQILVAREHPFELKLLSYYAFALRTLTAEADRARSTNQDTMGAVAQRFFIGFNPYNDQADAQNPVLAQHWQDSLPAHLRATFASIIDDYYACVGKTTAKPEAKYFAEKIGTLDVVRQAAAYMFGEVDEIVLIRDPRDVVCSSKSFWKRDFADSVRSLRGQFVSMGRPRAEPAARQHILLYEDLLLRPEQTMEKVYEFLDLPTLVRQGDAALEAQVFADHGTSQSPELTLQRWRRELTDHEASIANHEFEGVLERYGYPAA